MEQDRIALVTGASRGIGANIAKNLAADGYKLAIGYSTSSLKAADLLSQIEEAGGTAMTVEIVIDDRDSVSEACRSVNSQLGEIDTLVNNAGISQEKPFIELSSDDWHQMLSVNLTGAAFCSQEVIPAMLHKQFGRIINITSIGGQIGGINQVHYAAAKAGLISLTRSLARLYSSAGITVNAVAPGLVLTDMTEREIASSAGKEKIKTTPIGRVARLEEVSDVVSFLASTKASYMTGQTLSVNGGAYCG